MKRSTRVPGPLRSALLTTSAVLLTASALSLTAAVPASAADKPSSSPSKGDDAKKGDRRRTCREIGGDQLAKPGTGQPPDRRPRHSRT
ncbi:hypothetical protein [Streptomyces sp. KL116D]|uniref:hypothetical protein n=1 Tax=Streptomyces sp. KL116D TaxID=3045152 RepID=UPI0035565AEA